MLETHINRDSGVTSVTCRGKLSAVDIADWLREYYLGEPTPFILWDVGSADISSITADEIELLARSLATIEHSRRGGRTAIVSDGDLSFGMSRMYEIFAAFAGRLAQVKAFRTMEEARGWLFDEDEGGGGGMA